MATPSRTCSDRTDDTKTGTRAATNASRIHRRSFLTATGAGTVGALAGCLGGDDDGRTVALVAPLEIDVGVGAERMAQLFVDYINEEEGGIMDEEIQLQIRDTELSPSATDTAVQSLLQDGVGMISGTFASETALAVIDRISQSEAVFFTGGPASPQVVQNFAGEDYEQYNNIFQMCTNSVDQAEAFADYAAFLSDEHGWNSFSVMAEDAAWTEEVTQFTADRMESEHGLTINDNFRVDHDTTDWTPILDSVESDGSEVLLKAIAQVPGTAMLTTWAENQYPFAQEGTNVSSMSSRYWESTNGNCLYETTGGCTTDGSAINNELTEEAVELYQSEYDDHPELPMYVAFEFIDSLRAYKLAVEEVGSFDDTDAISEEIAAMDEPGAGGQIRFYGSDSEFPNSRDKEYRVFMPQWQEGGDGDGSKVPVWPEEVAETDHMAPDWM